MTSEINLRELSALRCAEYSEQLRDAVRACLPRPTDTKLGAAMLDVLNGKIVSWAILREQGEEPPALLGFMFAYPNSVTGVATVCGLHAVAPMTLNEWGDVGEGLEQWARRAGCAVLRAETAVRRVREIVEAQGWQAVETVYEKELSDGLST